MLPPSVSPYSIEGVQLSHNRNTLTCSALLLCSFAGRDWYMPHIFKLCTRHLAKCCGGSWCCWLGCFTILSAYVCYPNQALHAGKNMVSIQWHPLLSYGCLCIPASHQPVWRAGFVWSRRSRCTRPCTHTGDHLLNSPTTPVAIKEEHAVCFGCAIRCAEMYLVTSEWAGSATICS